MSKPGPSTKRFLDIGEIKEDVVIMKDGTLRAVFLASSINFALKSEEEQQAIISSYVGFLNSLDFSLQIVIQSRRLNIEKYIEKLKTLEKGQKNELLKMQIADYRQFIGELIEMGDIMSKKFYVTIPYSPFTNKQKGFFSRFKEILTPASVIAMGKKEFLKRKRDLMLRVESVSSGLQSMGIQTVQLDTQSLIELYYDAYNPDLRETQKMTPTNNLRIEE
ncbi:conjugal transfer protein TraC [Candidatus Parcubacteria bacterium]|nr:conjugal transfer protein TraC [Patescibacteria group bacterium]MCG2694101.1 conjugal transfer protein TraC [Candidatus Parcubacteria bacterium]